MKGDIILGGMQFTNVMPDDKPNRCHYVQTVCNRPLDELIEMKNAGVKLVTPVNELPENSSFTISVALPE